MPDPVDSPDPSPLVGRAAELAVLRGALDDAQAGRGRLVLVGGEPGIGKSRLLEAFAAEAGARGVPVFFGQCDPMDGAPDYWPWTQALRACLAHAGRTLPAGSPLGWLTGLPGDGGGRPADLPEAREVTRFQQADAVAALLRDLSDGTAAALLVEDVHWADRSSLFLLEFLAARVARLRLVVVATHRSEEVRPGHDLYAALAAITRAPATRRLVLRGLADDALRAYVRATSGVTPSDVAVAALARHTGGNPFFVTETMRWLLEQGTAAALATTHAVALTAPPTVREVVARRLEHLPGTTRDALGWAAVLGAEFQASLVATASGRDAGTVLAALEPALAAGLLVEAGPGLHRFAHALVRDVVYAALPVTARLELHRDVAAALETGGADGRRLADVAHHYLAAAPLGVADRAVAAATRAALRAKALAAHDESARHWAQALAALELVPGSDPRRRAEILLGLATAQKRAGDAASATRTFLAAADVARELGATDLLVRAAFRDGMWFRTTEPVAEARAIGVLEEACRALGEETSARAARLLGLLALGSFHYGQVERASELSARGLAMARAVGRPDVIAFALVTRTWTMRPCDLPERTALAHEIVALGESLGSPTVECVGQHLVACTRLAAGDVANASGAIDACRRLAERLGDPYHLWLSSGLQVARALLEGDVRAADTLIDTNAEHGRLAWGPLAVETVVMQRLTLFLQERRFDAAADLLEKSLGLQPSHPAFRAARAFLLAERGDSDAAAGALEAMVVGDFGGIPRDGAWLLTLSLAAFVFRAGVEHPAAAARLYELLRPYAGQTMTLANGTVCIGAVAWPLAVLAAAGRRTADAEAHWEDAIAVHRAMGARPFLARSLADYGGWLQAQGRPGDAGRIRALLDEAGRLARELGMPSVGRRDDEAAAIPPPARGSILRRDGETWTIVHDGQRLSLKDAKGLHYLAHLLRRPGQEMHVLDLVSAVNRTDDADAKRYLATADAGAVLDARARAAYRARLAELRAELDEAEAFADRGRIERARGEMEFLTDQLASAVGLGGRERRAGAASERARAAVTQAIRSVLRKIEAAIPALGPGLAARVRTGTFCAYEPGADGAIDWVV